MARPPKDPRAALRHLPPAEPLVRRLAGGAGADLTSAARTHLVRRTIDGLRARIEEGDWVPASREEAMEAAGAELDTACRRILGPHPRPVINAAGVLLHTNLGRAPLADEAIRAMRSVAAGYCDLEYDLERGERGGRLDRVEELLCVLTGADAAMAVNNNAAALLLALNTMAEGREVVVSRGHLVEIGGSFRMPEIMAKSGARMVEVGTTNKTHAKDYRAALGRKTALLLNVHPSNFVQKGFVADVPLADLVALGTEAGIPVLDDQGSGIMEDPESIGAPGEPTVSASLQAGAAVVTSSGDKLLGGPQAGIILGERLWVEKMRANPLARAVRLDKLQLSALEATLRLYLTDAADESVPVRKMARLKAAELRRRARAIADAVRAKAPEGVTVEVVRSKEALGGGSAPDTVLEGWSVALGFGEGPITASGMERALREGDPPLIARVSEEQVILTIRSVLPSQDARIAPLVVRALRRAANRSS